MVYSTVDPVLLVERKMTYWKSILASAAVAVVATTGASFAAVVDTIDANSGQPGTYFVPFGNGPTDSPYYRGKGEDWGWVQNGIAAGFTSATLNISAWDVDFSSGERDEIWVKNNGVDQFLGYLEGSNNEYSFTEFTLGADLFDDITAGLQVFMKIDTNTNGSWLVSLAKSVLATDGAGPGNPNPTPVPLPAAGFLLLGALGGLGLMRRRKKS